MVMLNRQLRPWRLLVPIRIAFQPRNLSRPIHAKATHDKRGVSVVQASILYPNTHHVAANSLIASTQPIKTTSNNEALEQAILLFTPAFAQSIAYDRQFLPSILNRLFQDELSKKNIQTMHLSVAVAVVDRLPLPSSRSTRVKTPPLRDFGSEGMSYIIGEKSELAVRTIQSEKEDSSRHQTRTLTVSIASCEKMNASLDVRIPLASTIFQAGQPSVLSLSSWVWTRKEHQEAYDLKQTQSATPSHISFEYPLVDWIGKIRIPLIPLTSPRQILAGMGNVIRQIEGDEGAITASQELEPAVSSYFAAKNLPPAAVNVWALVIPAELYRDMDKALRHDRQLKWLRTGPHRLDAESLGEIWGRDVVGKWVQKWKTILLRGARLHRVLSGGGGWGKKAGLISLDPDSDFKAAPAADVRAMFADSDLFETQEGMLGNAARVGDFVQFWIAPASTLTSEWSPLQPEPHEETGLMRFEIGTIPSTVDAMPIADSSQGDDASLPQLGVTYLDHFGFMSEKGVSVASPSNDEGLETEWRTKLTIPFSRLNCGRDADDIPATPPASSTEKQKQSLESNTQSRKADKRASKSKNEDGAEEESLVELMARKERRLRVEARRQLVKDQVEMASPKGYSLSNEAKKLIADKQDAPSNVDSTSSTDVTTTSTPKQPLSRAKQRLLVIKERKKERKAQQLLKTFREQRYRKLRRMMHLPEGYVFDPDGPIVRAMATLENLQWEEDQTKAPVLQDMLTGREISKQPYIDSLRRKSEGVVRRVVSAEAEDSDPDWHSHITSSTLRSPFSPDDERSLLKNLERDDQGESPLARTLTEDEYTEEFRKPIKPKQADYSARIRARRSSKRVLVRKYSAQYTLFRKVHVELQDPFTSNNETQDVHIRKHHPFTRNNETQDVHIRNHVSRNLFRKVTMLEIKKIDSKPLEVKGKKVIHVRQHGGRFIRVKKVITRPSEKELAAPAKKKPQRRSGLVRKVSGSALFRKLGVPATKRRPGLVRKMSRAYPRKFVAKSHSDVVLAQETTSSWNLLQNKRRARGVMGSKTRERYEEGLGTVLVRRVEKKVGSGGKEKEETPERKAERKRVEERENAELLSTVKEFLKGF